MARMLASVALNGVWDREPGGRPIQTRLDVLAIAPGAGRKSTLESVEMRWHEGCAGPERITLVAVTGGVSTDRTLSTLRQQLPAHVDLVVGGAGARRGRRGPQGITYLNDLHAYAVWLSALS